MPFWFAVAGSRCVVSVFKRPGLPEVIAAHRQSAPAREQILRRRNLSTVRRRTRRLGSALWYGDVTVIDGFFVNGSARVVGWTAPSSGASSQLHLPPRVHDDHRGVRAADLVVRPRVSCRNEHIQCF
jgi:hypothetical protein